MLEQGFEIIENILSDETIQHLTNAIAMLGTPLASGGIRSINKKSDEINTYIHTKELVTLSSKYLTGKPKLVRAIYFNKTPEKNWLVPWHQDKTVAVSERFELENWKNWSIKDQLVHVQPPLEVLNNMVTIRLHLDPSTPANGSIKIIPKSHNLDILKEKEIQSLVDNALPTVCTVPKGGALIMRPHLLHSSGKASQPSSRRILHLEYSSYTLPENIEWA